VARLQDAYQSWQHLCSNSSNVVHLYGNVTHICSANIAPPGGFFNIPGEIGWDIVNGIATLIGDIGYVAMSLIGRDLTTALLTSGAYLGLLALAREIAIAVAIGAFFAVLIRAILRSIAGNPIAGRELAQGLIITLAAVALSASGIIYYVGFYIVTAGPTIAGLIWKAGLHDILAGMQLGVKSGGTTIGMLLGAVVLWIMNYFGGLSVILTLMLAPIGILLGLYVTVALGALITSLFGVMILPVGMALSSFKQGRRWFTVALELIIGGVVAQALTVLVALFSISLLLAPISQTQHGGWSNAWFTILSMVFDLVFLVFASRILRHVISLASRLHDGIATHYNGLSNAGGGSVRQTIRPSKEDLATPAGVASTLAASAHKIDRFLARRIAGSGAKPGAGAELASAGAAGALGAALSEKALEEGAKAQASDGSEAEAVAAGASVNDQAADVAANGSGVEAEASGNEQQLEQVVADEAGTTTPSTADVDTSADKMANVVAAQQGEKYSVISRASAAAAVALTANRVNALRHQAEWRKRLGGDNSSLIQQGLTRRLTLDSKKGGNGNVTPQGPSVASSPAPTNERNEEYANEVPASSPRVSPQEQEPAGREPLGQGPVEQEPDGFDGLFTSLGEVPPSSPRVSPPNQESPGHGPDGQGEEEGYGYSL
jgi:hypothetical protein